MPIGTRKVDTMLEKPKLIWWTGEVREWADATVHVTSETAMRGTNVFEGLRAYWREADGAYAVIAMDAHVARLAASARLIHLPADALADELDTGITKLIRALGEQSDLYIRASVYLEAGTYTADPAGMRLGSYVSAFPVERRRPKDAACAVSNWLRLPDATLPTAAKVGAAYTMFRMARIDAQSRGADEPILLNERGTVAETAGASIFAVRQGVVYTPPVSDGILDSITRRIVSSLIAQRLEGVRLVEQSLSRSDLLCADEVFICGTLDEVRAVTSIDGIALPGAPGPLTRAVQAVYRGVCDGSAAPVSPSDARLIRP
jgi:branched-chain amino acid aminotransferase